MGKARPTTALVAHDTTGFPPAAQELARREALADETAGAARRCCARRAPTRCSQRARLLTLLVEFNPNANDDFSGWERLRPGRPGECVTEPAGTLLNGPLHNELPDPAHERQRARQQHVLGAGLQPEPLRQAHLLQARASRKKVRKDLHGGVDLRGRTVRNFYLEMSKGALRARRAA